MKAFANFSRNFSQKFGRSRVGMAASAELMTLASSRRRGTENS